MGIHQEIKFKASAEKIFTALTSGKAFGQITGRNIELLPGKGLVQAWRVGAWPTGVYSIVRITLEKDGNETKLTLDHTGFPDGAAEHLEGGWHKMYWEPLRSYVD